MREAGGSKGNRKSSTKTSVKGGDGVSRIRTHHIDRSPNDANVSQVGSEIVLPFRNAIINRVRWAAQVKQRGGERRVCASKKNKN